MDPFVRCRGIRYYLLNLQIVVCLTGPNATSVCNAGGLSELLCGKMLKTILSQMQDSVPSHNFGSVSNVF